MYLSAPLKKGPLPLRSGVLECGESTLSPDSFVEQNGARIVDFELLAPNRVRVTSPHNLARRSRYAPSNFTMIYDQGFEVHLPQLTLFAFSRFVKTDRSTAEGDPLITSYCNETQIGWYHDRVLDTHGCFFGAKTESRADDVLTHIPVNAVLSKVTTEEIKHGKWKNQRKLVDRINSGGHNVLWTAEAYEFWEDMEYDQVFSMLGGHAVMDEKVDEHVLMDGPEDILAMNDESLMSMGDDATDGYSGDNRRARMTEWRPSKRQNKRREDGKEDEEDIAEREKLGLPRSWDWRNVNGMDYTSIVRNQGSCGSCYVFAMLTAVESRIRIMTNNTRPVVLSPQEVVSCSHYSQKCHGGFPYLAAKYAHDYTVVPEDCMPYKADESVPCSAKCRNPKYRVRVKQYSYIGGFFGASNEYAMMVDIYRHGPIPVNFVVLPDFMYYKSGIYSRLKGIAGKRVRGTDVNPWEPVSHSVVIVGWDVDKATGTKFWIAQNSWGESWGENGFFRIRRGVDEASVESTTTSPIPELLE